MEIVIYLHVSDKVPVLDNTAGLSWSSITIYLLAPGEQWPTVSHGPGKGTGLSLEHLGVVISPHLGLSQISQPATPRRERYLRRKRSRAWKSSMYSAIPPRLKSQKMSDQMRKDSLTLRKNAEIGVSPAVPFPLFSHSKVWSSPRINPVCLRPRMSQEKCPRLKHT